LKHAQVKVERLGVDLRSKGDPLVDLLSQLRDVAAVSEERPDDRHHRHEGEADQDLSRKMAIRFREVAGANRWEGARAHGAVKCALHGTRRGFAAAVCPCFRGSVGWSFKGNTFAS
jgi:hypothetical protein